MFPPITFLRDNVQPGFVNSLPIEPIGTDGVLKEDDIITVVSLTGYVATFTVDQDVLQDDDVIIVEPTTTGQLLQTGSGVYLTQKSLSTWISQLEYAISIGAQITPRDIVTRVNAGASYLPKGTTYTPTNPLVVTASGGNWLVTRTDGSFSADGVINGAEVEIDEVTCTVISFTASTMTVSGDLTAGSYTEYILGRTTIPVDPIPIGLRGDLGWKVIVTDLENDADYLCELTTVSAAGATSLPIKPKILGVKDDSPLRLDQMSLISYINISADAIDLRSLFLAGVIYLGDISETYAGTRTSLNLVSPFLRVPIKQNDIIFIVDATDPALISSHTVSANTAGSATAIPINSSTVNKPINSKVFLTSNSSSAFLRITGDSITSAVQRFNINNSICSLSAGVNGTVTTIPITGLTIDLLAGDQFFIYDAVTLAPTAITLTADASSGATLLSITSTTLNVPSGSGVHLRSSFARSEIKQTADAVTTSVEKYSVAGSLGLTNFTYTGGITNLLLQSPGLPYAMIAGERVYVIDKKTGTSYLLQISTNQNAGATTIPVTVVGGGSFVAEIGSGVHVDTSLTRSVVNQTASSITSVVQTSSTANSFAVLSGIGVDGTNITSLPLTTGLPFALVNGQKLYVVNNVTGAAYQVVVNGNIASGTNAIAINSTTVRAPGGSGVNLNIGDYGTRILQTVDQVAITASKVYGGLFLSTTGVSYNETRTSLQLNNLLYPVSTGNKLYVVDAENPKLVTEVTAAENKAATNSLVTLQINSVFLKALTTSGVYLAPSTSTGSIKVLSDQVALAVTAEEFRDYLNGQFISEVQSVSSPNVTLKTATNFPIYKGDIIRFSHNLGAGQTDTSHPTVFKTVEKVTTPITGSYPAGTTTIRFENVTGVSADMIMNMEFAGPYSTGSSLQIFADAIVTDTPILRSENYDPGFDGWAIKGDGSAEFNNITARGSVIFETFFPNAKPTLEYTPSTISWVNTSTDTIVTKMYSSWGSNDANSLIVKSYSTATNNYLNTVHFEDFRFLGLGNNAGGSTVVPIALIDIDSISAPTRFNFNLPITVNNQRVSTTFFGSGAPSGSLTGSQIRDLYHRTDTNQLYLKTASSTWTLIGPP
jgi:hypothetical protein